MINLNKKTTQKENIKKSNPIVVGLSMRCCALRAFRNAKLLRCARMQAAH